MSPRKCSQDQIGNLNNESDDLVFGGNCKDTEAMFPEIHQVDGGNDSRGVSDQWTRSKLSAVLLKNDICLHISYCLGHS